MVLSVYIGCAGLTNEYVIRSIDEEQQVYRVVAELVEVGVLRCLRKRKTKNGLTVTALFL